MGTIPAVPLSCTVQANFNWVLGFGMWAVPTLRFSLSIGLRPQYDFSATVMANIYRKAYLQWPIEII
jgi:hypothetical protein